MRKNLIKLVDLCDLVDEHNRLLLRYKTGRIAIFENMTDMYKWYLGYLKHNFKNGYIEPGYLVMQLYDLNEYETVSWVNESERKYNLPKVLLINWKELDIADYASLRKLTQSLHSLLGTEFDLESFTNVFNELKPKKNE